MQLTTYGTGQGALKAGFFGLNKSGKSWTSALLACHLHKTMGLKTPIALFDTETSGEYIAPIVKRETGLDMIGGKSRSLVDLLDVARQCEKGAASILIVDSITHVWREVCEAYLLQVNKAREAMRKPPRQRLEFQDWNTIKEVWSKWPDFYLNSNLHIIVCGRGGYEWAFEETENADGSTRKELVKTGTKMKVESEFGFEPSLLVEMERVQVPDEARPGHFRIVHRGTIIGDRFGVMDGQTIDNPTGEWFAPYISRLTPGAVNTVDTEAKTPTGVDESGDGAWQRERKVRTILCEEMHGALAKAFPGQTAAEKKARADLIEECFGTTSKTKIESMPSERLRVGLAALRAKLNIATTDPEAENLDFGPPIEPKGE
jgi:hypothetical protein